MYGQFLTMYLGNADLKCIRGLSNS